MRSFFNVDADRSYYGTDARAYQLLIGAALAVALLHWKPRSTSQRVAVHVAGGIGALLCLRAITAGWSTPVGFLIFTLAVAAIITSVIQPDRTPLRAVLSLGPIVWIGRISYGIYLWHWPVIVLTSPSRTGYDGLRLQILQIALTFALATASFYLVERPIRRGALHGKAALILSPAAFVITAVVVIVGTSATGPPPPYLRTAEVARARPVSVVKGETATTDDPVRVLLVGDSMAASLIPGLEHTSKGTPLEVHALTVPGCGIVRGLVTERNFRPFPWSQQCADEVPRLTAEAMEEVQPDLVVWLSSWEIRERILDGERVPFGTEAGDRVLASLIDETATIFTDQGARLAFLRYPPRGPNDEAEPDHAFEERVTARERNPLGVRRGESGAGVVHRPGADRVPGRPSVRAPRRGRRPPPGGRRALRGRGLTVRGPEARPAPARGGARRDTLRCRSRGNAVTSVRR